MRASGFTILFFFIGSMIIFHSCTYNELPTTPEGDKKLFNEISDLSAFTYYQGGNTLTPNPASPHGAFKLRFNATAASALDGTGKLPTGSTFPSGSVLVKEVYSSGNLTIYAVMKKDPSDVSSAGGWLWAEINPNGTPFISTKLQGVSCIGCHGESPNRNLTRTFDFH